MKLSTQSGVLDTPNDIALEMECNNPFYSEAGSSSLPLSIPATRNNCRLLGLPDNINKATRFDKIVDCIASSGTFSFRGKLIIDSIDLNGKITCSFTIFESEIYASLQDKRLKDLFAGEVLCGTKSFPSPAVEDVYRGIRENGGEDLAIFPVATDFEDGQVYIVNSPGTDEDFNSPQRMETINGESITVPKGYGISPYIFLWALIQKTFTLAGYSIVSNIFESDYALKHIVVINSYADTLCRVENGVGCDFYYSDIVPDITIGELIAWLHDKFGAVVSLNEKGVSVSLFRDMATQAADMDLTNFADGNYNIIYPVPSCLKIESDTSLEQAAPAADSLLSLRNKFENCAESLSYGSMTGTGLFKVTPIGRYYQKEEGGTATFLGSDAFPYIRPFTGEETVISPSDLFVPMIQAAGIFYPYVGKRKHCYVAVGETDGHDPIMICYAFLNDHYYGSTYPFDEQKNEKPGITALTPEGLYTSYWKEYEKCLINGAPEIKVNLVIPTHKLLLINSHIPKRFKGVNVLIKSMTFRLTDSKKTTVSATLQLLPVYIDCVTHAPIVFGNTLDWVLVNSYPDIDDINNSVTIRGDGISNYTQTDAPSAPPRYAGIIAKRRERTVYVTYEREGYTQAIQYSEYFISEQV